MRLGGCLEYSAMIRESAESLTGPVVRDKKEGYPIAPSTIPEGTILYELRSVYDRLAALEGALSDTQRQLKQAIG